jgi:RNA polymerase sigma factor for flagellar operon FliA
LPSNIETDDLMQAGVFGLLDAYIKFDETRENTFKTYAEFRIRGAMLDHLRQMDWIPRSVRDKAKMLERARGELIRIHKREPTHAEVADHLGVTIDLFSELRHETQNIRLLRDQDQKNFSPSDKRVIFDIIKTKSQPAGEDSLHIKEMKAEVARAIKALPERTQMILALYYNEDLNLKEIGRVLRLTESRISQIHARALIKLRTLIREPFRLGQLEFKEPEAKQ